MRSKKKTCGPHTAGVRPGTPPFFYDGCPVCEQKKADGKVRGDEGPAVRPKRPYIRPEELAAQRRERAVVLRW